MNIAMLTTNMARGGAETQVAHLAIGLKRRGHDVHVISLLKPSAFERELAAAEVPLAAPGLARIPGALRRIRPEVLHCHMFHANLLGRMLRLLLPFRAVISTLHSAAESKRRTGRVAHRDLLYRFTDPLADATVAVSQAVAERHLNARAIRRAVVIPNGVDTEVFRPDPDARARMRSDLELTNEFVWIAAGRLMWKKNYPAMIRAMNELDRGLLLIAGSGPDEAELRAMAGPRVRFLGLRNDLPALLNAADAYVLSSTVEGLPVALLEAGATALPCVATDAGGVRETGIAMVVEADSIARAMLQVMNLEPAQRAKLGTAARRRVMDCYSMEASIAAWEALYRSAGRWM